MNETIKECNCGNKVFIITEELSHKASIDKETGTLEAFTNFTNDITSIACSKCGEEYKTEDFKDIQFCY